MDKITEIKYYRDLLLFLCDYIINQSKRSNPYTEWDEDNVRHYEKFKIKLNDYYDRGNYGMIKKIYNAGIDDLSGDYNFLMPNRQYFLDTYGVDLLDLDKKRRDKIAKIAESGKIKTDSQFRLIEEYVSDLCQMNGEDEMIERLNALLIDYHQRVAARMEKRKTKK